MFNSAISPYKSPLSRVPSLLRPASILDKPYFSGASSHNISASPSSAGYKYIFKRLHENVRWIWKSLVKLVSFVFAPIVSLLRGTQKSKANNKLPLSASSAIRPGNISTKTSLVVLPEMFITSAEKENYETPYQRAQREALARGEMLKLPDVPSDGAYYVAYGSNMKWEQIKQRCPDAEFISRVELPEAKLDFVGASHTWSGGGIANVLFNQPGKTVECKLFKLSANDFKSLDSEEGVTRNGQIRTEPLYWRSLVTVKTRAGGRKIQAHVYTRCRNEPSTLPSQAYMDTIREGAVGLSQEGRNRLYRNFDEIERMLSR